MAYSRDLPKMAVWYYGFKLQLYLTGDRDWRDGMIWYDMVCYGLLWFVMVCYGLVWFGMVWYGLVWFGLVWFCW